MGKGGFLREQRVLSEPANERTNLIQGERKGTRYVNYRPTYIPLSFFSSISHSTSDRLASWGCTLSRSFSSVSLVASRFVLEQPIVGLVARRPRVRPTSRPYDPKPRRNLPFALFRSSLCSAFTNPAYTVSRCFCASTASYLLLPPPLQRYSIPRDWLSTTEKSTLHYLHNTFYQFERISRIICCQFFERRERRRFSKR